jgi:hypothetical protein
MNKDRRRSLMLAVLWLVAPTFAAPVPLPTRYALAREVELGNGTLSEAVTLYRELLPEATASNHSLAATLLFRIGACERERGRVEEARQAWKQLIDTYPADPRLSARAREAVKELDREVGRVLMRGRVVNSQGQPLAGAYVVLGDWGNAPPLITGAEGAFQADRQAAGRLAKGERYGLVYAELPVGAPVMVGVWRESSSPADFCLRPSLSLAGYVVDTRGRPVVGATLRLTGFETGSTEAPLPFGRLFPPVATDTNGQFQVNGLAEGLRYALSAEKDGYRMGRATVDDSEGAANGRRADGISTTQALSPDSRVVYAPEMILQPVGRIAVDEAGILRAEVNLNDPAERARLEEAMTFFDPERKDESGRDAGRAPGPAWLRFPYDDFPFSLRWLRGDPPSGSPLSAEDLKGKVVVYHFSSAYLDASIKRQFPGEPGFLSQLARLFGAQGVRCVWILPADDGSEDAARLALETCTDLPIAVDRDGRMWKALGVMGYGGNVVVDRDGIMRAVCPDQHVFKVLKGVLAP